MLQKTATKNTASKPVPSSGIHNNSIPAYLMNIPYSLGFEQPNNATMNSLPLSDRQLDLKKSLEQFQKLYSFMTSLGIVYLIPSYEGLQDQAYVSNVAVYLPHLEEDTIILSNFRSDPRIGEEKIAQPILESIGYKVIQAPLYFEGEADLKHLKDNIYIGAHGMRTSNNALQWMQDQFDMNILPVRITDPQAYHLDCIIFSLDPDHTLVCTELLTKSEIKLIETLTNVIDVPYGAAMAMATNCLRIDDQLLAQTNISLFHIGEEMYDWEKEKINLLEVICSKFNLNLNLFDLSEFRKSGAALSCFVMKLNRQAYGSK